MAFVFKDIQLVGMDENATQRDPNNTAFYNVVLKVNDVIFPDWGMMFDHNWKNHFYNLKRNAEASGNSITIFCVLDELQDHHIPNLKQVIENTNIEYRKKMESDLVKILDAQENLNSEKEKLASFKNSLKF